MAGHSSVAASAVQRCAAPCCLHAAACPLPCSAEEQPHTRPPRQILHRDLKSENVLLARDEQGQQQAKLADFGLHKLVRRPGARAQWSFSDIK